MLRDRETSPSCMCPPEVRAFTSLVRGDGTVDACGLFECERHELLGPHREAVVGEGHGTRIPERREVCELFPCAERPENAGDRIDSRIGVATLFNHLGKEIGPVEGG